MKKIAFIGCSHFAAFGQECQLANNWTYQLYQKYPQHQYRNYSCGGRGPDYFRWALMDAKLWEADIVFLNRTSPGRWSFLADIYKEQTQFVDFRVIKSEHNWEELELECRDFQGDGKYSEFPDKIHPSRHENKMHSWLQGKMKPVYDFFIKYHAVSELKYNYDLKWYRTAPQLYNFNKVFLIDWETWEQNSVNVVTSNICETPVIEWFKIKYNTNRNGLHQCGIFVSTNNEHLSLKGNTELLNEYILSVSDISKELETY